jgi:hypothetical protein
VSGLVIWGVIFAYLIGVGDQSDMPLFVWFILFSYFFYFLLFPVNMFLQYRQIGNWADAQHPEIPHGGYYYGEKGYQVLSLASKTTLSLIIFLKMTQPNKYV